MSDNYPPGVTGNDIDNHFGEDPRLEAFRLNNVEVKYQLIVTVNDTEVYNTTKPTFEMLEEQHRHIEEAIDQAVQEEFDDHGND